MAEGLSRSDLLRGDWRNGNAPVRPPWFRADAPVTGLCDGCGICIEACPTKILTRGRGGCPQVDFARGGCDFCGACAAACPRGAFESRDQAPWKMAAMADDGCLSMQGVTCQICAEHCEAGAIRLRRFVGGYAKVEVDAAACTGCGACVSVCPARSITVRANQREGVTA